MPRRIIGDPPLKEGNVKDITVDNITLSTEFLNELGWDTQTTIPSDKSLRNLGMDFLLEDMSKLRSSAE